MVMQEQIEIAQELGQEIPRPKIRSILVYRTYATALIVVVLLR